MRIADIISEFEARYKLKITKYDLFICISLLADLLFYSLSAGRTCRKR